MPFYVNAQPVLLELHVALQLVVVVVVVYATQIHVAQVAFVNRSHIQITITYACALMEYTHLIHALLILQQ